MSILKKLLAPVLDRLNTQDEDRNTQDEDRIHRHSAMQSKLDRIEAKGEHTLSHIDRKLYELKEDTQAWKAGELVVDVKAVNDKFTEICSKLVELQKRIDGVGNDVDRIDLTDIDFSSIESAVESAIESGCEIDTSDLDYGVERVLEEARDASSIAGENRTSLEELLKLFKDVWPDGAGAEDEPEPEPEPEQPEHDALQQFAAGEYPVVQIRIIGKKLLICDHDSVIAEHYLPDTTADAMKAYIVKTMAPICDELAADRPWMTAYNSATRS